MRHKIHHIRDWDPLANVRNMRKRCGFKTIKGSQNKRHDGKAADIFFIFSSNCAIIVIINVIFVNTWILQESCTKDRPRVYESCQSARTHSFAIRSTFHLITFGFVCLCNFVVCYLLKCLSAPVTSVFWWKRLWISCLVYTGIHIISGNAILNF